MNHRLDDRALQPGRQSEGQEKCGQQNDHNHNAEPLEPEVDIGYVRLHINRSDVLAFEGNEPEQLEPFAIEPDSFGTARRQGRLARLGITMVSREELAVGSIEAGRYDGALRFKSGKQLAGCPGVPKAESGGAVGAEHLGDHAKIVPHQLAPGNLIVSQNRHAHQQKGHAQRRHDNQA